MNFINRKSIIVNRVANGWVISNGIPSDPEPLKIAATEADLLRIISDWALIWPEPDMPPASTMHDSPIQAQSVAMDNAWVERVSQLNDSIQNLGAAASSRYTK